jgi:hypothetical protein
VIANELIALHVVEVVATEFAVVDAIMENVPGRNSSGSSPHPRDQGSYALRASVTLVGAWQMSDEIVLGQ